MRKAGMSGMGGQVHPGCDRQRASAGAIGTNTAAQNNAAAMIRTRLAGIVVIEPGLAIVNVSSVWADGVD